jgi:hypothetical protein
LFKHDCYPKTYIAHFLHLKKTSTNNWKEIKKNLYTDIHSTYNAFGYAYVGKWNCLLITCCYVPTISCQVWTVTKILKISKNLLVYMQAIKALFLYFIICLSVKLGSFSSLFKWISFLTNLANLYHLTEIKHLTCLHFIQLFYSSLYPNRQIKIILLFPVQWDGYDQHSHQTLNYSVKRYHLHMGTWK